MSLFVEPDVLWAEARALAAASNRADELAGSVPSSVDGGVGTAAILGILSVFAESGGERMRRSVCRSRHRDCRFDQQLGVGGVSNEHRHIRRGES